VLAPILMDRSGGNSFFLWYRDPSFPLHHRSQGPQLSWFEFRLHRPDPGHHRRQCFKDPVRLVRSCGRCSPLRCGCCSHNALGAELD